MVKEIKQIKERKQITIIEILSIAFGKGCSECGSYESPTADVFENIFSKMKKN